MASDDHIIILLNTCKPAQKFLEKDVKPKRKREIYDGMKFARLQNAGTNRNTGVTFYISLGEDGSHVLFRMFGGGCPLEGNLS